MDSDGEMLASTAHRRCTPITLELEWMTLSMAQFPYGLSKAEPEEHGCVAVWNDFVLDKPLSGFRFTHHTDGLVEALLENVAVRFCCVEVECQ